MSSRLENESGYSLVEVLAAIVILTLAIIPMVTMFDTGLRSASTSGNYDKARTLANTQLETVKGMEYETAETDYPPDDPPVPCNSGIFDCEVDTTHVYVDVPTGSDAADYQNSVDSDDPKDMMRIVVTVEWGNGNSYSATGLAAR